MSGPDAFDVIVLGAGPAGARAALAAASQGLKVILIDEQAAAGGQVWRKPWNPGANADKTSPGDQLRAALAASSVQCAFGHRVWSIASGFHVDAVGPDGATAFSAAQLIAASGAHERIIPFKGWTLPGVMGLAAATVLLKAENRLPGQRVVVAGRGPLLAAVAAGVIAKGGEVAAVIDRTPLSGWLKSLPALATQPRLLAEGAGWLLQVIGRRVPWLFGCHVSAARGENSLETVDVARLGVSETRRSIACDALVAGDGLVPGAEAPRLLKAPMRFDRLRGGWVPIVSADFESGLPGLFCAGDGAGVRGAVLAGLSGEIAGLCAAAKAGRSLDPARFARIRSQWNRAARFSDAIAGMLSGRPADIAGIAPDTVICRCEDVTCGEIDAAIAAGAVEISQLKHFTRCGMGPCQGRMCGDVVQELMAERCGKSREAVGSWTARPPLRPVLLGDLVGAFTYADIPVPEPAPL